MLPSYPGDYGDPRFIRAVVTRILAIEAEAAAEAEMEYADCWHEGDRLRSHLRAEENRREMAEHNLEAAARQVTELRTAVWKLLLSGGFDTFTPEADIAAQELRALLAGDKAEAPLSREEA
jgi:hypothetical protein